MNELLLNRVERLFNTHTGLGAIVGMEYKQIGSTGTCGQHHTF